MNSVFTDEEHRILLAALEREKQVCREYDQEHDSENKLAPIVKRIERKVYDLQNQDADLKRHFLAAEEPEWDPENRFHRRPAGAESTNIMDSASTVERRSTGSRS